MDSKATTVENYIASFPPSVQSRLLQMRTAIRQTVPEAEERISYGMPGYKYKGVLVYFAGYKKHIGFYPMPSTIRAFTTDLQDYVSAKGSVQFPLDTPLPLSLIKQMVKYRMTENEKKEKMERSNKKASTGNPQPKKSGTKN